MIKLINLVPYKQRMDFQMSISSLQRLNMPFLARVGLGEGSSFFCQSPFTYNTQCPQKTFKVSLTKIYMRPTDDCLRAKP